MTFPEVFSFYKTNRAIAKVLNFTDSRISQFKAEGGFPYSVQCVLEKESKGQLIARRSDVPGQTK
ncbi:hypothetical protein [Aliamphritea ceti]|uniref:hypothetical protein n=1 Tax=Aliamphritea ceti TaxID=1524258 RepID=UPI0021C46822|nr:hypothetical protein [Aliamphritea ceti]